MYKVIKNFTTKQKGLKYVWNWCILPVKVLFCDYKKKHSPKKFKLTVR